MNSLLSSITPRSWQGVAALVLLAGALLLWPLVDATPGYGTATVALIFFLLLLAIAADNFPPVIGVVLLFLGAHGAAWLLLAGIAGNEGTAGASFYLLLAAAWLLAWRCVTVLSALRPTSRWAATALRLIIPAIFGAWILIIWEAVTRGAGVPFIMTFFPMLVNTVAGLAASGHMERDLMRTYASSYWQTLFKLRLPAAAPFIFNALKINSTLALIGAIVAEFFGTPVVGMGFRISTEVGRMNIDMVWAEIAVAALAGSVFYGVVALFE
ncbi:MAG: ABC transporter permease subunit, partial [Mesorhizobium sp.]